MAEVATKGQAIVRHRDEGDAIWAVGSLFMVKLAVEESGGPLSVMQVVSLPGGATPLHVHHTEAEAFYLLEGEMTYQAGEDVFELRTGSFVYLPKDLPHRFRVRGTTPSKFLAFVTPGVVERLDSEVCVLATARRRRTPPHTE